MLHEPSSLVVGRLWDDETFYQRERRRCLTAAETWRPERLLPRFEEFFGRVIGSACRCRC